MIEVFNSRPHYKHLHIVIQPPPADGSRNHLQLSHSSLLYRTQQLRSEYSRKFPQEPPSSQGKPCKFELIQENPDLAVRWNRPPSVADAIPSTLLHPVFGAFMDDCENIEPTPDDNELVMALSVAMSGFFGGGAERACRFREVLQEHDIDLSPIRINGATYNTDGDQQYKYFRHAIAQVTNEIGSTEAELHMQALSCYIHSTNSFAKDNPAFRFPSIVITLFGECVVFDNSQCTDHDLNMALHRFLSRCLEHPSEHAGDFDCFTSLLSLRRYHNACDSRAARWCAQESSSVSLRMLQEHVIKHYIPSSSNFWIPNFQIPGFHTRILILAWRHHRRVISRTAVKWIPPNYSFL